MPISQENYMGVITADIVSSQSLTQSQYEQLLAQLKYYLSALRAEFGAEFHIFRGDSFQIALPEAKALFKQALLLQQAQLLVGRLTLVRELFLVLSHLVQLLQVELFKQQAAVKELFFLALH